MMLTVILTVSLTNCKPAEGSSVLQPSESVVTTMATTEEPTVTEAASTTKTDETIEETTVSTAMLAAIATKTTAKPVVAVTTNTTTKAPGTTTQSTAMPTTTQPAAGAVTSIKLSETAKTVTVGDKFNLTVTLNTDAANKNVTWTIDNGVAARFGNWNGDIISTRVAGAIDIHARQIGNFVITVTSNNGLKATCNVTVNKVPSSDTYGAPFDINAIKNDLVAYGERLGMTHYAGYTSGDEYIPITSKNMKWENETRLADWVNSNSSLRVHMYRIVDRVFTDDYYGNRDKFLASNGYAPFTVSIEPDTRSPGNFVIYIL